MRTIKIVKKGESLEPESGFTTPVKKGEEVTFVIGEGMKGVSIRFTGASPFGPDGQTVEYGDPLIVEKAHVAGGKNKYGYECEAKIGEETLRTKGSGGEIEVTPEP